MKTKKARRTRYYNIQMTPQNDKALRERKDKTRLPHVATVNEALERFFANGK